MAGNNCEIQLNLWLIFFASNDSGMYTVAHQMFDRFYAGAGGSYSNSTLTNRVLNHVETKDLINATKSHITNYLSRNGGSLYQASSSGTLHDNIWWVNHPSYNRAADYLDGLKITLNGIWGYNINVINYAYDCVVFKGTLRYRSLWTR